MKKLSLLIILLLLSVTAMAADKGKKISRTATDTVAYSVENLHTGSNALAGFKATNDEGNYLGIFRSSSNYSGYNDTSMILGATGPFAFIYDASSTLKFYVRDVVQNDTLVLNLDGTGNLTLAGYASATTYYGDASNLTGAVDNTKVLKSGDTMTGSLIVNATVGVSTDSATADTLTVTNSNASAVGDGVKIDYSGSGNVFNANDNFEINKRGEVTFTPPAESEIVAYTIDSPAYNFFKFGNCAAGSSTRCGVLDVDWTGKNPSVTGINLLYTTTGTSAFAMEVNRTDIAADAVRFQGGLYTLRLRTNDGVGVGALKILHAVNDPTVATLSITTTSDARKMRGIEVIGTNSGGHNFLYTESGNTATSPVRFNHIPLAADSGTPASVQFDLDFSPMVATATWDGKLLALNVTGNATGTLNADVISITASHTTGTVIKADNYGTGALIDMDDSGVDAFLVDNDGDVDAQSLQLVPVAVQPTCDVTSRGTFWYTASATLVKDKVEVCAKDVSDVYAWRTIY